MSFLNTMRTACLGVFIYALTGYATAQSAAPSPAASPSSKPAESRQPGAPVEYPKPSYPDLLPRFDYDSKAYLDMRETNVEKRGDVRLVEINYSGASGDRVPAYLLIPHGNGPFPAIIWGHWLKPGSPLANKDEFLDEALVLARSGVASLLIDAPQVRHDFVEEKGSLLQTVKQQSDASGHQVIDLRRGVDLLLGRRDIDRKRIAYVGHSWDAHVGAILAGVESRICCYVLMASGYSDEEETFGSKDPQMLARIKEMGEENVREYFHEYAFDDPVYFAGHTDEESLFLQFASGDQITKELGQKYLDRFSSKDKKMEFYSAGHALNATARLDRDRWLQKHLGLKKIDEKELESIRMLSQLLHRRFLPIPSPEHSRSAVEMDLFHISWTACLPNRLHRDVSAQHPFEMRAILLPAVQITPWRPGIHKAKNCNTNI